MGTSLHPMYIDPGTILRTTCRMNLVFYRCEQPARHFILSKHRNIIMLDLPGRTTSRQHIAGSAERGDVAVDRAGRDAQRAGEIADGRLGALRGGLLAQAAQPLLARGRLVAR